MQYGKIMVIAYLLLAGCKESCLPLNDVLNELSCDTLHTSFLIGEEIGDSTNMFWSIASADIDGQGRIFVLDDIDCSVRAYDLQGNYLQQVTRKGSGPGELLYPKSLTVMPNGNIMICASSVGGFVVFNDSLEFVREIELWQNNSPYHVSPLTGSSIVASRYNDSDELALSWHTLAVYNLDTPDYEILLYKDSLSVSDAEWEENPSRPMFFSDIKRLESYGDGHGNVYVAAMDTLEYRVFGWDSLGHKILSIERGCNPVEKTLEEIAAEAAFWEVRYRNHVWPPFDPEPFQHRLMVADVGIGPDGNLWVRRGTRLDLFFDVFDLEGNLLHHFVYPIESFSWKTEITPYGILAWELDPPDGYQKLFYLE